MVKHGKHVVQIYAVGLWSFNAISFVLFLISNLL